jgi:hypothetical protein
VILEPASGDRHDLLTVTTAPQYCADPMQNLAWSPDGNQIAFDQQSCCTTNDLYQGEIDLVAADGSDGASYRVAVPTDDRHLTTSPTWRNAHSIWFQRQVRNTGETDSQLPKATSPDLYSISYRNGTSGPLVQRTATKKFSEIGPSFG